MANNVCWYCHRLKREDGNVLRMALDLVVEGQKKKEKEAKEDMEEADRGRKHEGWFVHRRHILPINVDVNQIALG